MNVLPHDPFVTRTLSNSSSCSPEASRYLRRHRVGAVSSFGGPALPLATLLEAEDGAGARRMTLTPKRKFFSMLNSLAYALR